MFFRGRKTNSTCYLLRFPLGGVVFSTVHLNLRACHASLLGKLCSFPLPVVASSVETTLNVGPGQDGGYVHTVNRSQIRTDLKLRVYKLY